MTMSETTPQDTPQGIPAPSEQLLVTLTEAAAAKVVELRSREGKADAALRLFVKSGGCSGFSYSLGFAKDYDEKVDGTEHDRYLWGNAVWALAARVTVDIPESLVEREVDRRTDDLQLHIFFVM